MPMMRCAPQLTAESGGGQTDWSQAGYENGVVSVDPDLREAFVNRAESACHLSAIGVSELRG